MDLESQGAGLTEEGQALKEEMTEESGSQRIVWRGAGAVSQIQCEADVLAEIAELAMSGYRGRPWGGVEVGGVLFGKHEAGTVHISQFRVAECEHRYGPAFDFSDKDSEAFEQLLASAGKEEGLALVTPVGWYQTVSR